MSTLLGSNLGLKRDEHFAFVYDEAFKSLVEPIRDYCVANGINFQAVDTDYDGIKPLPAFLKDLILGASCRVLLFGVVHNIWHTPERKEAKYGLKKRMASIVCAPNRLDQSPSGPELSRIALATRQLSKFLTPGASVHVTSPAGCDFTALVKTPFCEDGEYDKPGTGGDFPAGEVGFGPEESSVNGRIVYDVKVQHLGLLESPLFLTVDKDKIAEIAGAYHQAFIDLRRLRGDMLNYISEISLGLNPFIGVTPEPEFIPEEKLYGTAHCGHGGNASYGNRVGPHIDGVIKFPTVKINGALVMEKGQFHEGILGHDLANWLKQF